MATKGLKPSDGLILYTFYLPCMAFQRIATITDLHDSEIKNKYQTSDRKGEKMQLYVDQQMK